MDQPFEIVEAAGAAPFLFVCDHAANAFPPAYETLGLAPPALLRHIAYDIGARALTHALAGTLGAGAIMGRYSRLLIDLNRGIDDPTLIAALSDGAIIPGNHPMSEAERAIRIARYHAPYHAAIDTALDGMIARGLSPKLISIHSFTPVWRGQSRPWHVGVLWNADGRLALPLLDALRREGDLVVGDNEPYSGVLKGDCMDRHGTARNLAHVLIEIRQDLLENAAGIAAMAALLARILAGLKEQTS